jgi:AbiV family abortive infection protein
LRATSSGAARSRRALLGFAGAFETQWLAAPKNFAGEAGKKVEDLIAGRFNRKGERCRKCSMAKGTRVVTRYRGALSPQQITHGMNASVRNAKRLFADAKLLFEAKRYPSACSLAILSIEESGKLAILRGIAVMSDSKDLEDQWQDYRNHYAKNAGWIIDELLSRGARTLQDLNPIFDEESPHPEMLDVIKQLGFYTDCYGNAYWSEPSEAITEDLAKQMLSIAHLLLTEREVMLREVQLWIEHVGDCWDSPAMRLATINFWKAMRREGLSDLTDERIEEFYRESSPTDTAVE